MYFITAKWMINLCWQEDEELHRGRKVRNEERGDGSFLSQREKIVLKEYKLRLLELGPIHLVQI